MSKAQESADRRPGVPVSRENVTDGSDEPQTGSPEPAVVLAAYGTLAPDRSNHRHVANIAGDWYVGIIRGRRWTWSGGPYDGLPALRLDPAGDEIRVWVLVSDDLPAHWARLDAFEGEGYRRVTTVVNLIDGSAPGGGSLAANVYEAIKDPDDYEQPDFT